MQRKKTRAVSAGSLKIGGGSRISIQTMWKKSLHSFSNHDLEQIIHLEEIGCDILRFSVPDIQSADILNEIRNKFKMPLVADIHFDHKIALKCIEYGIDKIRINPGNIGAEWKVREVLDAASYADIPIRIGINGGSLHKKYRDFSDVRKAMLCSAEDEIEILEKNNFKNAVFSLKSSDLKSTIDANISFSKKYDYPLHLGVTEAGPGTAGTVKTSIAFYKLFSEGIGDTIRVSLTDVPAREVLTGREILKACGLSDYGATVVSCPRCGRSTFDTHSFIRDISEELEKISKPVKIAIMGCVVNGPGEASGADIGITGAGNKAVIFKHGKILRKVDENESRKVFIEVLNEFIGNDD